MEVFLIVVFAIVVIAFSSAVSGSGRNTVVVSVPMDMRSIPGLDNAVAMVEVEVAAQESGGRVRDNSR
ncbi:hypothetical protein ACFT6Z_16185, partial [Streptomyces sp. NPDC057131]|uniref:hypothetical protein n=1 Tax=Streptomyces sp. NPDC057131 TaxID=3346027 RepID=UPI00362F5CBC